jgi:hypothetical protein
MMLSYRNTTRRHNPEDNATIFYVFTHSLSLHIFRTYITPATKTASLNNRRINQAHSSVSLCSVYRNGCSYEKCSNCEDRTIIQGTPTVWFSLNITIWQNILWTTCVSKHISFSILTHTHVYICWSLLRECYRQNVWEQGAEENIWT